jgi:hypothetical protein
MIPSDRLARCHPLAAQLAGKLPGGGLILLEVAAEQESTLQMKTEKSGLPVGLGPAFLNAVGLCLWLPGGKLGSSVCPAILPIRSGTPIHQEPGRE